MPRPGRRETSGGHDEVPEDFPIELPEMRLTVTELFDELLKLMNTGWSEAIIHAYEGEESGLNIFYDIDKPDGVIFIRTGP